MSFFLVATNFAAGDERLRPRQPVIKPDRTIVDNRFRTDAITVKFQDDALVRLRNGGLTDFGTNVLTPAEPTLQAVADGQWMRTHTVQEEQLDQLRATAEANLGRACADLNTSFKLILPQGVEPASAIDRFNQLECVELALPIPKAVQAPLPPNFQQGQIYLDASPSGIDAVNAWTQHQITGEGVKFVDIEYSFNENHEDLPAITLLGDEPNDPFDDSNHGTAVFGQVTGIDNGWGITGGAYGCEPYFAAAKTGWFWDVGAAIMTSLETLGPGDVMLIEQQMLGPNEGQYVPVEWWQPWYNAIVIAVGNGVTVVEAAGNGGENLDDPIYSMNNNGHWPFLPENDSGAIIVGAGAAPYPFGSDVDRSRLVFSNYGSAVDLQGWGEGIWTTGYGEAWSDGGENWYYTVGFSGTSGASPIVASACILAQSASLAASGDPLSPDELLGILQYTAAPQQAGQFPVSEHIGPRPDVNAALDLILNVVPATPGAQADLIAQGYAPNDRIGKSVAGVGDLDGDGYDDFAVGAYTKTVGGKAQRGRIYVYSGLTGDLLWSAKGQHAGDQFGISVASAGDATGDGIPDIIVGARRYDSAGANRGKIYLFSGEDGELIWSFAGGAAGDELGVAVAGVGDVNNDGYDDVIAGAYRKLDQTGRMYVFSGLDGSIIYHATGESSGDHFGYSVAGVGDVNGDGRSDFAAGAFLADSYGYNSGTVNVYSGLDGSLIYQFGGEQNGDQFGISLAGAGDVDNDGFDDIIIGARFCDIFLPDDDRGEAYVYSGQTGELLHSFSGQMPGAQMGFAVGCAGDVNADGFDDLIVGSPEYNGVGRVDIFSGENGMPLYAFAGEAVGDRFGQAIGCAGDLNGDTLPDAIIGAAFNDNFANKAGRAYLFDCPLAD